MCQVGGNLGVCGPKTFLIVPFLAPQVSGSSYDEGMIALK